MQNESATLTIAIVGIVITYTASIVSLVLWLAGKFRSLEKMFYQELSAHREEDNERFKEQHDRLYKVELNVFGFTKIP